MHSVPVSLAETFCLGSGEGSIVAENEQDQKGDQRPRSLCGTVFSASVENIPKTISHIDAELQLLSQTQHESIAGCIKTSAKPTYLARRVRSSASQLYTSNDCTCYHGTGALDRLTSASAVVGLDHVSQHLWLLDTIYYDYEPPLELNMRDQPANGASPV